MAVQRIRPSVASLTSAHILYCLPPVFKPLATQAHPIQKSPVEQAHSTPTWTFLNQNPPPSTLSHITVTAYFGCAFTFPIILQQAPGLPTNNLSHSNTKPTSTPQPHTSHTAGPAPSPSSSSSSSASSPPKAGTSSPTAWASTS